jgi:ATP-dependent RNA helicase SUPV3L1/SUV3
MNSASDRFSPDAAGRNVVAVLGPTNTGKTHLAIERMLGHASGVIGLPLRLLAREVYNRVAARVGPEAVALITGEEKIIPPNPRYRVCTVEAMPAEIDAAFLAIDEIQLAADLERGHVFTDRMLNLRGRQETLLLGAATMRGIVERLIPGVNVVTRPRMSVLSYSGSKKITRLPRRSAVVAFSADDVYAIAELIRRQRGGAAVVLGALSPRTRNAQVELYQSGDVDFLVATDAIGMGLNLDLDHVAFAADRKFDGFQFRRLTSAELGQIAGRAGRHLRDGTFGVTSRVDPFEDPLVEALENHRFDSVKMVQWRNRNLDFASIDALRDSLDRPPTREGLAKALPAEDANVLEIAQRDPGIRALADRREQVALLWDVCQIPDYRRIALANHAELVMTLYGYLARDGVVDESWFASQVAHADHIEGDIDTLANRIAHIRTWTFAANRPRWLADPAHWQERTRAIEDRLSDALHERLTQRFVDRRTSVLMRRLRENAMLDAEVTATGDVLVEGQHVGQLLGFRFAPDPGAVGTDGKALRAAAQKSLAGEIDRRAERLAAAPNPEIILSTDGVLRWRGDAVARVVEGADTLKPRVLLLADEMLTGASRDRVQARLDLWTGDHATTLLKPLIDLRDAADLPAAARGVAFRLVENLGVIERTDVAEEVRALDQDTRASLRRLGVRFGAYHIYVPALLKPGPSQLLALLWALRNGGTETPGVTELPQLSSSGRTTIPVDPTFPRALYRVVGFRIAGPRAIRIDILERLADLVRPLLAWRATPDNATPPTGAVAGGGFTVTVAMTSLLGCSGAEFAAILTALGYRVERRPMPPAAEPAAPAAEAPGGETQAEPVAETAPEPHAAPVAAEEETASADAAPTASAEDTTSVDAAPAETPAPASPEPQFIEIWRPGRAHRGPRRERNEHRRREHQPAAKVEGAPPQAAGADGQPPAEGAEAPRRERHRHRRPDRKPDGQHRDHRRPDRPREERRERPEAAAPRRPEKVADPNSPFAALAALKAQLENQNRK